MKGVARERGRYADSPLAYAGEVESEENVVGSSGQSPTGMARKSEWMRVIARERAWRSVDGFVRIRRGEAMRPPERRYMAGRIRVRVA